MNARRRARAATIWGLGLGLALALMGSPALAQQAVSPCTQSTQTVNGLPVTSCVPVTAGAPLPTTANPVYTNGNGSLATSTSSAAINTMTVNAGGTLPAAWNNLIAINIGSTDVALCIKGGTCTCPENGVANTNGITLLAGGGGYSFNLAGTAIGTPTIVACSGTPTVQFQW